SEKCSQANELGYVVKSEERRVKLAVGTRWLHSSFFTPSVLYSSFFILRSSLPPFFTLHHHICD
ncbi:hypothetical protein, partial [Capnocytophaga gingivalis]|uniref:hypothetical protein n=1 Tax=Capnocytophaga gingivalis TaxID=1017 RepID=UPI0028D84EBC